MDHQTSHVLQLLLTKIFTIYSIISYVDTIEFSYITD